MTLSMQNQSVLRNNCASMPSQMLVLLQNYSFDDLHEDGKPDYSFSHQELDDLETYELGLDDDGYYEDGFPSEQFSDDAERFAARSYFSLHQR